MYVKKAKIRCGNDGIKIHVPERGERERENGINFTIEKENEQSLGNQGEEIAQHTHTLISYARVSLIK